MSNFSGIFRYLFIFITVILTAVMINIQAIKIGYSIEKEEKEVKNLISSNKYISKQISVYKAPRNIELVASQMGLKYPEPYSIVIMDGDREKDASGKFEWLAEIFNFQFSKRGKAG